MPPDNPYLRWAERVRADADRATADLDRLRAERDRLEAIAAAPEPEAAALDRLRTECDRLEADVRAAADRVRAAARAHLDRAAAGRAAGLVEAVAAFPTLLAAPVADLTPAELDGLAARATAPGGPVVATRDAVRQQFVAAVASDGIAVGEAGTASAAAAARDALASAVATLTDDLTARHRVVPAVLDALTDPAAAAVARRGYELLAHDARIEAGWRMPDDPLAAVRLHGKS